MTQENKKNGLYSKILKAQAEIDKIDPDKKNSHLKSEYASLPKVLSVVLPALQRNGIFYTNRISTGTIRVSLLDVETGDEIFTELPLINNIDMQKIGSCITYSQRYGLLSLLGLCAGIDDDGEHASTQTTSAKNDINKLNSQIKEVSNVSPDDTKKLLKDLFNNNEEVIKQANINKYETIKQGIDANFSGVNQEQINNRIIYIQSLVGGKTI